MHCHHRRTTHAFVSSRLLRLLLGVCLAITAHASVGLTDRAEAAERGAPWAKQLTFEDVMEIYAFPEQLISYRLTFPENRVTADGLKVVDSRGREVPIQLSEAETSAGFLSAATVHFRSDLPRGATRRFTLKHEPGHTRRAAGDALSVRRLDTMTGALVSPDQRVRVPWGEKTFEGGRLAAQVPAPLVAVQGRSGNWICRGTFRAPADIQVLGYDTQIEEQGPLFLTYRVTYRFTGGREYTVRLTVQRGDDHVTVDEYLKGFEPEDKVFFRFDFEGLNPDARLVMSNAGYNGDGRGPMSGPYAAGLEGEDGDRLPYELLLFTPNSLSGSRATTFWRDDGEDALLLSINRPEDWKTSERYVWHSRNKPENLRLYAKENERYMETQLAGEQRHWAIAAIPRDEVIIAKQGETEGWVAQRDFEANVPGGTPVRIGAGPEVRLYQRLTDFNLDDYKDMVIDFEESLEPLGKMWPVAPPKDIEIDYTTLLDFFKGEPEQVSADDFWNHIGFGGGQHGTMDWLVHYFWDWSASLTHRFGAFSAARWMAYANSRANWSQADRRKARAQLVFMAELADGDGFMPHHSMMGGHPNFISEAKFDLAFAAAVFPEHPRAEAWKQSYMDYLDEWLDVYVRKPDPAVNAHGGRHMENISTYAIGSLRNAGMAAWMLLEYDGTAIFDDPRFENYIQWVIDGLAPFEPGSRRRLVPIGAHSYGISEARKLGAIPPILARTHPDMANQLLWAMSNGEAGTHVPRESKLYRDYGGVLWYDHGGENEAMLTVQQLHGSGYRWTGASNGALYYATDGHNWSWNKGQTNGDKFDIEKLPLFNLDGRSLGAHPVDELLHNFDEAQFYRANGSHETYRWRGVMMRRDEYLAVYDRVADDEARGKFQWINEASRYDKPLPMPEITPIKEGPGDQLHIVSPEPVRTKTTDYGVIVNDRDHVLFTAEPVSVERDNLRFKGRTGLAGPDAVYLFEGEHLFYNDLGVKRDGGDFGVGVWYDGNGAVEGRIVGREGGRLSVRLPEAPRAGSVQVQVAGEPVEASVSQNTVTFPVQVSGADGYKPVRIRW